MGSSEKIFKQKMNYEKFELPPGFRFHPTDEELINQYLVKKVDDNRFSAIAIAEVDMNKCEPWDLPEMAKMGEKEWYYFNVKDRKYSTGHRINRATKAGYWKATGKDKEIFHENALIGMKKTLVFYIGRAPEGEKTNWIMHEYRLEGNTLSQDILSKIQTVEWVISRIYEKGNSGKKSYSTKLGRFNTSIKEPSSSNDSLLPSLIDYSPYTNGEFSYVINPLNIPNQMQDNNIISSIHPNILNISSSPKQIYACPFAEATQNCFLSQEQSMMRMQFENEYQASNSKQSLQHDVSLGRDLDSDISSVVYGNNIFQRGYENQELIPDSTESVVFDQLWNY